MYFLWLFSRVSTPGSREREQYRPVSLYDCLSFLLSIMSVFAFIFALIFISFICSSSASASTLLFVRSACVSKFIFLFVSTVNLMCLWHVLTVSSWRGYRRGYWRFMLTFFFIISHIHHSVGLFSSHTCVWVSAHLPYSCSSNGAIHAWPWLKSQLRCTLYTGQQRTNNRISMFVVMASRRISLERSCK